MQKTIGFIGYSNKTEYIINLAKVLNIVGKKVLVADGTLEQKFKYSIPTLNKTEKQYVEHFDGIDFAIGFTSVDEIKKHILKQTSIEEQYDLVIIDIDNVAAYESFAKEKIDKLFLFLEYSNIAMAKNKEILKAVVNNENMEEKSEVIKVLFSQYVTRASEKYFMHQIEELEVKFSNKEIVSEYMDQDRIADIEFEQSGYIDMSRHTKQFTNSISEMAEEIFGDIHAGEIKKIIKLYARGRM